ncbi:MAG: hypothetical protein LUE98_15715 [Tannerellaceae bacterium]|nr:hypothetical protein [Tannerellaceae bacterium]
MNNKTTILKNLFSNGFVRLPRKVANGMYLAEEVKRNYYRVYAVLLILAHPKKFVDYNYNSPLTFEPGELLLSRKELSGFTGVADWSVARSIKKLEANGLITTRWKEGKTLFHINYYEEITHHYVEIDTGEDRPSTGSRKQTAKGTPKPEGMTATEKELFEESKRVYLRMRERQKNNSIRKND